MVLYQVVYKAVTGYFEYILVRNIEENHFEETFINSTRNSIIIVVFSAIS